MLSLSLYVSMLAVPQGALGEPAVAPPDTSRWQCKLCPFERSSRATATVGAAYVTDGAAGFGDANGMSEQGSYLLASANGDSGSGSRQLRWSLDEVGLDSRRARVEAEQPGKYRLALAYSEFPHHVSDSTRTVYAPSGRFDLTLPENWVRAGSTAGMAALTGRLVARDLATERAMAGLDGRYRATRAVELFGAYRRERRQGTGLGAGAFWTQASLLPQPIDERTEQLDAGVRYRGDRGHVQLAYYGSFFRNSGEALVWDNPFTSFTPGAARGAQASSPDSDFGQLAFSASYRLARDTTLALTTSAGRMRQSVPFAPYSIDPVFAAMPLPRSDLDGKVDTRTVTASASHRPHRKLRLLATYRYEQRDNRTEPAEWDRVIAESFSSGELQRNVAYDFSRSKLSLSGELDLARWSSLWATLEASYDYTEHQRNFQEVSRQTERTGWTRARVRSQGGWDASVRGGTAKREIDRYDLLLAQVENQNPLLRKYHLAYRYREFADARLALPLAGWPVTVGVNALYARDRYTLSLLGLQHSDELDFAGDLAWTPTERLSLHLYGGVQEINATQTGSASFGAADWRARHDDRFVTLGGGARAAVSSRIDLELTLGRAVGDGDMTVLASSRPANSFPRVTSRLNSAQLRATYRWSDTLEALLYVRYEHARNRDWALDGVMPDTLPSVLTLGGDPHNYSVAAIGLSARYAIRHARE